MTDSFVALDFECKIINNNCTKVIKNNLSCQTDSDCTTFFSHCSCNNYCRNKNYIPTIDCASSSIGDACWTLDNPDGEDIRAFIEE
jgi:hypothetical protein